MRITFYDTRISNDDTVMLVKERAMNYAIENISNPSDAATLINKVTHLNEMAEEYGYMIALNTKNKPIGIFLISKGTANYSTMNSREVFLRALLIGATVIIVFHNHPSKDTFPSESDVSTTKKLVEAGKLIGIPVMDHIIIGGKDFYSFKSEGIID